MRLLSLLVVVCLCPQLTAQRKDGNRLAYLDELNLYYPSHTFPKLITPQWVGEKDVDAVVILAIDDMKDSKKYETYLRPILDRLKKIDGRAPVSIMSCAVDPKDPQLQIWLKEGVSIECHTFDHPCPFFKHGFKKAKDTYEKCVDLMHTIPNNKPVAFRMPCCDSMNTPSPRFFAEIFNKTSEKKNYLTIDSSVFMAYTSKDPELPKNLVLDKDGKERFLEYFPKDRAFVNWIENYPYPYMIGRQCWQFPCMTPSDWQAQHRHKPFNPKTVEDWKAALDCTVIKKGVFTMVFHPHGWIKAEQVVELIDYAVEKYGKKVKFLNFGEALGRLEKNLTVANAMRVPGAGWENGIRILDVNADGWMDCFISNEKTQALRIWENDKQNWAEHAFSEKFHETEWRDGKPSNYLDHPFRFLRMRDNRLGLLQTFRFKGNAWHWGKTGFTPVAELTRGIDWTGKTAPTWLQAADIDGDAQSEFIVGDAGKCVVYVSSETAWRPLPFQPPFIPRPGQLDDDDNGVRLADLNADGKLDLIFSNEKEYGIYLFTDMKTGWSKKILAGKRGDKGELPMISKSGTNNGFFIHSGHFWWSNEDTALLRDFVDRRKIADLLKAVK